MPMLLNYLISSFRFFFRNKFFSFINLFSLAVGLACVVVIMSWVIREVNYDTFHKKVDRVYRMSSELTMSGEVNLYPTHHAPVGQMVADAFPEVELMSRFSRAHSRMFELGQENILVEDVHYADSSFFKIFSFHLLQGDSNGALNKPNTLVLTQSVAKNFFGDSDPMGQVLISDDVAYTITGVVADPPENSTIQFKVLEPMITATKQFGGFSYGHGMAFETWLLLKPKTNLHELESRIDALMDSEVNSLFKSINVTLGAFLEPMADIYLNSRVQRQAVRGNRRTIAIFIGSALLVLIIACFNFVNLSTVNALRRAKEVGVRKVFGATRKQLIIQYLGESILIVLVAMALALVLAEVSLPFITTFSGETLSLFTSSSAKVVLGTPVLVLIVGLGAGWYPALFLSRFSPTAIFRQPLKKFSNKISFKSILSFFQFGIMQILVICTIVVFIQLQHIKTKDLGFNTHNLISIRVNTPSLEGKYELLRSELAAIPYVENAALHSFILGHTILARDFVLEGSPEALNISYMTIDNNYFQTYGIELAEGRLFQEPLANEERKVIVNETFVERFGYDNPIGRKIFLPNDSDHRENEIVGVVKDFNYMSLHSRVAPMVMLTWHDPIQFVSLRLSDDDIQRSLAAVKAKWEQVAGDTPFLYFFVDDKLGELYVKEDRFGKILSVFTLLAIAVACAGLFGLTAHIMQTRRKEIAIRKVLGANTSTLTTLVSLNFLKGVAFASLFAWPAAWYISSKWLENFANRISIPLWVFLLATLASMVIALATTLVKTYVTSNQNPAVTLKYE